MFTLFQERHLVYTNNVNNCMKSVWIRDHWEDLGVGGRITLRWTLGGRNGWGRTGFGWLRI